MTPTAEEGLLELVEALCCGTIAQPQYEQFQARLAADPDARQLYFRYLDLHLQLRQWRRAVAKNKGESGQCSVDSGQLADEGSGFRVPVLSAPAMAASSIPLAPVPRPFSLLPCVFSGALVSYAIAVLVLSSGVLAAWMWRVGHDESSPIFPMKSQPAAAVGQLARRPETPMLVVGQITGLSKCRWADPKTSVNVGEGVLLGRKFVLSSGLLEITYSQGARVTIEGPAVYQVDSVHGGFLTQGTLTAKVEVRDVGRRAPRDGKPPTRAPIAASQLPDWLLCFRVRVPSDFPDDPHVILAKNGAEFVITAESATHDLRGYICRGPVWLPPGPGSEELESYTSESPLLAVGDDSSISVGGKDRWPHVAVGRGRPPARVREMPGNGPSGLNGNEHNDGGQGEKSG